MAKKKLYVVESTKLSVLPVEEQALFDEIISAYSRRRLGTLNHRQKSVQGDVNTIYDFINYCEKAPWFMTEEDFDNWCYHLGHERKVVPDTQRKYQTAIQSLFTYIIENVKFSSIIRDRYRLQVKQLVTPENKIPHLTDRQRTNERPALSHDQINHLFASIDQQILEAHRFNSKGLLALQRDKALFYTMYIMGLRDSECCDLDIDSFRPNPSFPDAGAFGLATIYGKGSRGTGAKIRPVVIDHPDLPPILDWYAKNIRTQYLAKPHADPNERAFFLNERGHRIKVGSLISRFHVVINYAGLDGLGFTPHCLRHTATTHGMESGYSTEYLRRKLGHEFSATTQGYTHCGDEFVAREVGTCTTMLLDQVFEDEEENNTRRGK